MSQTATAAPAPGHPEPASHPLEPLARAEYDTVRSILDAAGVVSPSTRFAYVGLEEPSKADVLAGGPLDRRARVMLLDIETGAASDLVVSLADGRVLTASPVDRGIAGDVPQLGSELTLAAELVTADARWLAALELRGVDPALVQCDAFTAGNFDIEGERDMRLVRVLPWRRPTPTANYWAYPIEGLIAYVDLLSRTVVSVTDTGAVAIPEESGDFMGDGDVVPVQRLRPLEIHQPDGPSFQVDGHAIEWDQWTLRVGFDMREGLTLHQLRFAGRDIVYRASIAEMVVPYGDPSPLRFWTNYFDTGEYLVGRLANSLVLGCDCLGDITYLDAVVAGEHGEPVSIANAICIHEEDAGVLWKHTDGDGRAQTRRSRRFVVSYVTTVGNYDYAFYWYLYQDGRIEHEVKLNGIVFTTASPDGYAYASRIAPGLSAPYHQHLFSARLDMMVDGVTNRVDQIEAVRVPMGEGNLYGNGFTRSVATIVDETDAARFADASTGRVWNIVNPGRFNRLGHEVGYTLRPQHNPTLMADDGSSVAGRAAFATRHLWVTAYDPAERYPAGDYVNQSPRGEGLPAYQAAGRNLDGADVVVWHTFGLTHFPRTEDWPVMPVDHVGFALVPYNFFDRNPALDAAPPTPVHAHGDGAGCDCSHGDGCRC
ncbi:primary-amine oxidase [Amnibacterium flavum]|uniref:Amine oxidase n=1 Tax=Amnibacterium flavum TaxID=2173173 RepID=A0A2V1HR99_9MICO|nr:primary-amine oxidase [Amnibacterium flavum]PVZ95133.1 histamine oxidase [Amnibacterium flavum]